jgi:hypothetical protein
MTDNQDHQETLVINDHNKTHSNHKDTDHRVTTKLILI